MSVRACACLLACVRACSRACACVCLCVCVGHSGSNFSFRPQRLPLVFCGDCFFILGCCARCCFPVCSAHLASAKDTIPYSTNRCECEVAALVTFVMPVMVMRHLSVRQPRLHRMRQVPVTTDARMLLQRFGDPDQTGCPEHGVVQWDNELRRDVPDERVQQVI